MSFRWRQVLSRWRIARGVPRAAKLGRERRSQYERSHELRKLHVTEANKSGMGFNGL